MKNIYKILLLSISVSSLSACSQKEPDVPVVSKDGDEVAVVTNEGLPDEYFVPGTVDVKVTEEFALRIEACTDEDGKVDVSAVRSMGLPVKDLGIISMKRLFPYAAEYEERTRQAGLHLWYTITYNPDVPVTKSGGDLRMIDGITIVDYSPVIAPVGGNEVIEYVTASAAPAASGSLPFNDPLLADQWHYYNDGSRKASQSGCDINVVPVWKNYATGNENVVVAVVDGGIDYTHEDLADNMWHDPEDSRHVGYNFCTENYVITAHDHGTHVAGTIAAVNNNGKGVCGIAGGNSAAGQKGVKLMSCQIFSNKDGSGSGSAAIKWAADHGAVIAQNSWGMTSPCKTPQSLKDAVDYFIKNAGMDSKGKQTGPMAGGIVVFAAGNDNSSDPYGIDYENMVIVTSVGADYCKAYYSNYGDWCHIAAPGGDAKKGNQVISTLPDNQYGRMQGTSMACPHVSGVAALVLSKKAAAGFTSTALRTALLSNTTDISAYTRTTYMGKGLVNAYRAIASGGGSAPEKVTDFSLEANSNNVKVTIKVPRDADDKVPNVLMAYYSTSRITSTEGVKFSSIYVGDAKEGEYVTGKITNLDFSSSYYVAVVACDLAGNMSKISENKMVMTGINHAPVFTPAGPVQFSMKRHETKYVNFTFTDPDEHYVTVSLEKGHEAEVLDTTVMTKPFVNICAQTIPDGTYHSKVIAVDQYGLSASFAIDYTVLPNHKPVIVSPMPDQVFGKRGETISVNESEYFKDEDGEQLSYDIKNSDESVVNVNYSKGQFYITSLSYGYADITVKAVDCIGETVSQSFRVLVRDGNEAVDIYPNPVRDFLYVRTSTSASADMSIISTSGAVVYNSSLTITPFEPAKVDFTSMGAGVYTVKLVYNGETITRKIVKI